MYRRFSVALAIAVVALTTGRMTARQALTADDIIAKNLQAKGGLEKMRSVQTLKQTGHVTIPNVGEATLTLYSKRPSKTRQEMMVAGMTSISAYDGQTGWAVSPIQGITTPMELTGSQLEPIKAQADFDGPLVDSKAKGYTIAYVGTELVDGKNAYHLKITALNKPVQHCYIDVTTNLEMKVVADLGGATGQFETDLSDYRDVDGLKMPFSVRSVAGGNEIGRLTVDKVELNAPIDDAIFRMPKGH